MIKKLSAREKKLLIFLSILLIGFVFFRYIYLPQTASLKDLKDTLQQKQDQYQQLQNSLREKNAWQKNPAREKMTSLPDFLGQVSALANQQGVTITSFQPEEKIEGSVKQTVLHIKLQGDFLSLQAFFFDWERKMNSAILTSVDITPTEGEDKLQATLLVKALFL